MPKNYTVPWNQLHIKVCAFLFASGAHSYPKEITIHKVAEQTKHRWFAYGREWENWSRSIQMMHSLTYVPRFERRQLYKRTDYICNAATGSTSEAVDACSLNLLWMTHKSLLYGKGAITLILLSHNSEMSPMLVHSLVVEQLCSLSLQPYVPNSLRRFLLELQK